MNALAYVGLFAIIIACISVGGLVIVWAMSGPTALDDELSQIDIDTDRAELRAEERSGRTQAYPSPF